VAISSASEFEAVLSQAILSIEKVLFARGDPPVLKQAKRDIEKVLSFSREPEKLKQHIKTLNEAIEVIGKEIKDDEALRNSLWDCSDYVDFGC
jgi:hypothetical protein